MLKQVPSLTDPCMAPQFPSLYQGQIHLYKELGVGALEAVCLAAGTATAKALSLERTKGAWGTTRAAPRRLKRWGGAPARASRPVGRAEDSGLTVRSGAPEGSEQGSDFRRRLPRKLHVYRAGARMEARCPAWASGRGGEAKEESPMAAVRAQT